MPADTVRELKQLNFFFFKYINLLFAIYMVLTLSGRAEGGMVVPQQALKEKWDILGCVFPSSQGSLK